MTRNMTQMHESLQYGTEVLHKNYQRVQNYGNSIVKTGKQTVETTLLPTDLTSTQVIVPSDRRKIDGHASRLIARDSRLPFQCSAIVCARTQRKRRHPAEFYNNNRCEVVRVAKRDRTNDAAEKAWEEWERPPFREFAR